MKTAEKIAVSVPRATLASVEKERHRVGRSRSSVVSEALDEWLKARLPDDRELRYARGYLKHPEADADSVAVAAAAVAAWEPWE